MSGLASLRIGPIARISLGLVALLVSLVLLADLLLGVVPSRGDRLREARQRVTENLALQFTALLETGDTATLGKSIRHVLARDADISSITVRRSDGSTLLRHGLPTTDAPNTGHAASTVDHLRVPILAGRQVWGEVDVHFVPTEHASIASWLAQPYLQLLLLLAVGGFLLCYAYLRRAMQYLNPSSSVPERVRTAFDSISEGLLVLDLKGRIVLANKAFRHLHPQAEGNLTGQHIDDLDWLLHGAADTETPGGPWRQTLLSGAAVSAQALELQQPDAAATQLLVSSAAITDNKGRTRGCLVTFDNVSAVHRANEELRSTLGQLEKSRQLIEEQNSELRRLASRDALTGCFNRRAFFEQAEDLFAKARLRQASLCCLMIDIDHFKQFNDRYGHAVGDQVIQVVARSLAAGLRQVDVLARYGGEEFCIVLPGAAPQDALAVAERIRIDIETRAHRAIRGIKVQQITASFGLVALHPGVRTIEALIDQADQALYSSKNAGRNRVTLWEGPAATASEASAAAVAAD